MRLAYWPCRMIQSCGEMVGYPTWWPAALTRTGKQSFLPNRGKGGHHINPNPSKFRIAFSDMLMDNILIPPKGSNCKDNLNKFCLALILSKVLVQQLTSKGRWSKKMNKCKNLKTRPFDCFISNSQEGLRSKSFQCMCMSSL